MNILVTGGAGFIGTNLITRLMAEGHTVTSIDDYSTGTYENHLEGVKYRHSSVSSLKLDKNDTFDIIFHLAALSRIQPSFTDPSTTFVSNVHGTQNILEQARLNKIKVVYAGSSSKWHDPYQSPYAMFKYLGEEVCKMYKQTYGCNVEIARFYNVYGPNEIVDGDMAALLGIWRNQIAEGKDLTIVGDGEQRRDFTHVTDIVDGLYRIAMSEESHTDAWELGTGKNFSINEVYNFFKERFPEIEKQYLPDQKGNYRVTIQKNTDAQDRLDWKPLDRLKKYITKYIVI
jgi:UDP-glucose 4-epimerase|tara:strand:- start:927 stop:1787 length:861 start_codon:yes stop_codon:yes gene_type:complete